MALTLQGARAEPGSNSVPSVKPVTSALTDTKGQHGPTPEVLCFRFRWECVPVGAWVPYHSVGNTTGEAKLTEGLVVQGVHRITRTYPLAGLHF